MCNYGLSNGPPKPGDNLSTIISCYSMNVKAHRGPGREENVEKAKANEGI